jgi:hypothetical protein
MKHQDIFWNQISPILIFGSIAMVGIGILLFIPSSVVKTDLMGCLDRHNRCSNNQKYTLTITTYPSQLFHGQTESLLLQVHVDCTGSNCDNATHDRNKHVRLMVDSSYGIVDCPDQNNLSQCLTDEQGNVNIHLTGLNDVSQSPVTIRFYAEKHVDSNNDGKIDEQDNWFWGIGDSTVLIRGNQNGNNSNSSNSNNSVNGDTNTNNNSDNNTNVNSQNENNNALPPTHHICQNQSCVEVNGDGMDTCTSDNDCVVLTYHICQNHMCVEQIGTGTDRCTSDEECQDQLQNLYIITNPFNGLMVGYEVSNNMVVLHVTPSSGSHSWFLRGTSGGKLDTYTGDRVIYTPGSVAGEDVISVSDGTNKAYVDIKVTYAGNTPRFDMKTTNMVVQQGIFPLNVSVGADVKETISFKALAEYKDPATGAVTYRDVTGSATWTSGNTEIGKIDATGMLLAIKPGTTRVSALFDSVTSNAITVYVNPTFPGVNPSTYEARFNPNPVAKGYSTRLWVFVESDSGNAEDIRIVSADLSNLNIAPVCTGSGTTIENCQSLWMMTPAQQENHGRWYYMDIRVPFTVADGTYPIRIAATNNEGNIDRHFSLSLRVVAEVKKGDVNGDGQLSIADAVLALQVAVHKVEETDPKVNITADVNGDGHIGLPEAIYVLKQLTLSSL